MRRRLRQPVLAEIPERLGARPGALNRAALEAFSGLAEGLQDAEAVLATGPAGSAVALGLAAAAAVRGRRVALLECDLAEPVLAETLGIWPEPGLHEYLRGDAEPPQILQPLVAAGPASGAAVEHLTCVVAGSPASAPEALLGSARCHHAIAMLRRAYEFVVLDGPPLGGDPASLDALAATVDVTIVCGSGGELPKRSPLPGARFVVVG